MSIFLAVNTTGAPNTLFSERSLNNLAAAKLSEVGAITMRSGPRVIQQDLVFGHLAQFLSAAGDPTHAYAPNDIYPVGPHLSRDFVAPVDYPIVQVVGASQVQIEEMIAANGRIRFYQARKKVDEYTNANKEADAIGGFNFESFYKLLKQWVDAERKKNANAPRGVKRPVEGPAGEDDEAKKRRKDAEEAQREAAEFFL